MLRSLLAAVALSLCVSPAQSPAPASFKLAKIEVVGAQRYTTTEVVKVSGLNIGQTVAVADLDGVVRRLASVGLFKSVKYQYQTTATDMALTFSIEEEALTTPVVFDNFVWFKDDELAGLLQQSIPQFNGMVPSNAGISAFLTRELEQILAARRIAGRVEFALLTDRTNRTVNRFVFSVTGAGAALRVCAVRFDGAQAVGDAGLQDAAKELKDAPYSRSFTVAFANGTLMQLYRRRGFWKASIAPPTAVPDAGGGCGGVTVTFPVSEGPAYVWDHAEWIGNAVIPAKDLNATLAMKVGDPADVGRIETGLRLVHDAYGKKGYVAQAATFMPRPDGDPRKAVVEITVTEGPQFVMGDLAIIGLPPSDEANLRKKWRLQPGAVYDATYSTQFVKETPLGLAGSGGRRLIVSVFPDAAGHRVNVKLEFK
jgi:outer membrane protein assembly factor BamA